MGLVTFTRRVVGGYRKSKVGLCAATVLILMCAVAMMAPSLSTVDDPWNAYDLEAASLPPSVEPSNATGVVYLLGTDILGRDVYSMMLYGIDTPITVLIVVFVASVTAYIAIGWLGRASSKLSTRGRSLLAPLPGIVSLTVLSVPVVILLPALRYGRYDLFGIALLAVVLAISMSLWGWEAMTVPAKRRDVLSGQDLVRSPGNRMLLADALRASKLSVLVALPVFVSLRMMFLPEAGLFELVQWADSTLLHVPGTETGTTYWWLIVPPVACMLLLSVSAYATVHVLEMSVRASSEGTTPELHADSPMVG